MRILRLFSILDQLRTNKHPVSAEALAARLTVSTRTIYRDMATLQQMGAPIRGESGIGYQIEKGYFLPPLQFDPDELDAITLGIRMISTRGDVNLAAAAARVTGKINAVLENDQLDGNNRPFLAHSTQLRSNTFDTHLDQLRQAVRKRQRLDISYVNEKQEHSDRLVRPLGLTVFEKSWVLTAWCEYRSNFRNFRVDRLQSVEIGMIFPKETGKEFKDYLLLL